MTAMDPPQNNNQDNNNKMEGFDPEAPSEAAVAAETAPAIVTTTCNDDTIAAAAATTTTRLSTTSKQYDIHGKGYLDSAEQHLRDLDTENVGMLSPSKVLPILQEQKIMKRKLSQLKWILIVLGVLSVALILVSIGTSFAAAKLAKDLTVDQQTGFLISTSGSIGSGADGTANSPGGGVGGAPISTLARSTVLQFEVVPKNARRHLREPERERNNRDLADDTAVYNTRTGNNDKALYLSDDGNNVFEIAFATMKQVLSTFQGGQPYMYWTVRCGNVFTTYELLAAGMMSTVLSGPVDENLNYYSFTIKGPADVLTRLRISCPVVTGLLLDSGIVNNPMCTITPEDQTFDLCSGGIQHMTFEQPKVAPGDLVNYCLDPSFFNEANCGSPVADKYCLIRGYAQAQDYVMDFNMNNLPTRSLQDNTICNPLDNGGQPCHAFASITCKIGPKYVYPKAPNNPFVVDYCFIKDPSSDPSLCGKPVADKYCELMGHGPAALYPVSSPLTASQSTISIGDIEDFTCTPTERQCYTFEYIVCTTPREDLQAETGTDETEAAPFPP